MEYMTATWRSCFQAPRLCANIVFHFPWPGQDLELWGKGRLGMGQLALGDGSLPHVSSCHRSLKNVFH